MKKDKEHYLRIIFLILEFKGNSRKYFTRNIYARNRESCGTDEINIYHTIRRSFSFTKKNTQWTTMIHQEIKLYM